MTRAAAVVASLIALAVPLAGQRDTMVCPVGS
jgi:hypothetical protein